MICKQCNKYNEQGNAFCVACGAKLQFSNEFAPTQDKLPSPQDIVATINNDMPTGFVQEKVFEQEIVVEKEQVKSTDTAMTVSIVPAYQSNQQANICVNCNTANVGSGNFCVKCGFRLDTQLVATQLPKVQTNCCQKCGTQNNANAHYCVRCGFSLSIANQAQNKNNLFSAQEHQRSNGGNGMSIAGLVMGIISCVFCLGGLLIPAPILGIIFSSIGLYQCSKNKSPKGKAIAGLVCSIIGLVLIIVYSIVMSIMSYYNYYFY